MKVIQFTVPIADQGSVVIQEDILPYFYSYLHRHNEIQITSIILGEGTLIVGNYTQPFKAGEVYVIGANVPHMFKGDAKYFETNNEKNIHAIHIFFDSNKLQSVLNLPQFEKINGFLGNMNGSLHLPSKYTEQVTNDIFEIRKLEGLPRFVSFTNLLQFFSTNVVNWKSLITGVTKYNYTESEGLRMNAIFQYIIENFSKQIDLAKIASIAHMTPHAFCKYFKKHTRKTYLSFLNEIRVNEVCKVLLKEQFTSISTVAYAAGFNSVITFNRVFKKTTNKTPSEYIKNYKFDRISNHE